MTMNRLGKVLASGVTGAAILLGGIAAIAPAVSAAPVTFKARQVTAVIPTRVIYNAAAKKTVVLASHTRKVKARERKGWPVEVFSGDRWVPVGYIYRQNLNRIVFSEAVRNSYRLPQADPLGTAPASYIVPGNIPASSSGGISIVPDPTDLNAPQGAETLNPIPIDGPGQEILNSINATRASQGTAPIANCVNVNAAANSWSAKMAASGQTGLAISQPDGSTINLGQEIKKVNYLPGSGNTWFNYITRQSPPGGSPILNIPAAQLADRGFDHLGVGHAGMPDGSTMWTVIFLYGGRCVR